MFPHIGMYIFYNTIKNMVSVQVYGTKWWFSGAACITPIAFPVSVMVEIPVVFVRPESNHRIDRFSIFMLSLTEAQRHREKGYDFGSILPGFRIDCGSSSFFIA